MLAPVLFVDVLVPFADDLLAPVLLVEVLVPLAAEVLAPVEFVFVLEFPVALPPLALELLAPVDSVPDVVCVAVCDDDAEGAALMVLPFALAEVPDMLELDVVLVAVAGAPTFPVDWFDWGAGICACAKEEWLDNEPIARASTGSNFMVSTSFY